MFKVRFQQKRKNNVKVHTQRRIQGEQAEATIPLILFYFNFYYIFLIILLKKNCVWPPGKLILDNAKHEINKFNIWLL